MILAFFTLTNYAYTQEDLSSECRYIEVKAQIWPDERVGGDSVPVTVVHFVEGNPIESALVVDSVGTIVTVAQYLLGTAVSDSIVISLPHGGTILDPYDGNTGAIGWLDTVYNNSYVQDTIIQKVPSCSKNVPLLYEVGSELKSRCDTIFAIELFYDENECGCMIDNLVVIGSDNLPSGEVDGAYVSILFEIEGKHFSYDAGEVIGEEGTSFYFPLGNEIIVSSIAEDSDGGGTTSSDTKWETVSNPDYIPDTVGLENYVCNPDDVNLPVVLGDSLTVEGCRLITETVNVFKPLDTIYRMNPTCYSELVGTEEFSSEVTQEGCPYEVMTTLYYKSHPIVSFRDSVISVGLGEIFEVKLDIKNSDQDFNLTFSPDSMSQFFDGEYLRMPANFDIQTIWVSAQTSEGCYSSDQFTIETEKDIFIPNAFSPNRDGNNDMFTIFTPEGVAHIEDFQIFARWGERVFHKENFVPNDVSLGWDGMFNGQVMNPGVFVYMARLRFIDGTVETYKGGVTLTK